MARRRSLRRLLVAALGEVADARRHIAAIRVIEADHTARALAPSPALAALDEQRRALADRHAGLDREAEQDAARADGRAAAIDRQHLPGHLSTLRLSLADLARAAPEAAPGWLGRPWPPESGPPVPDRRQRTPVGRLVRVGRWQPGGVPESAPLLVPLLGRAHLQIEVEEEPGAAEPTPGRQAALAVLRGVIVRVLASSRPGDVRLLSADPRQHAAPFAAFAPLADAGLHEVNATSLAAFRAVLDRCEQHVARVVAQLDAAGASSLAQLKAADPRDETPFLLLAVASLPDEEAKADIGRLAMLARSGVAAGLHLLCIGCPLPLPDAGRLVVGPGRLRIDGLGRAEAEPEPDPGDSTVGALCRQLAEEVGVERHRRRPTFSALLPASDWTETAVAGLRAVVGVQGGRPFEAALDDTTPHWLIGGRAGAGKTAFLLDLLYAFVSRYSPDELAVYLLDCGDTGSFGEFCPSQADPSWLPHARAVGIEADREYGLAVLRALCRETMRRSRQLKRQGVSTLAALRRRATDAALPRILAVVDEAQALLGGEDAVAVEAIRALGEIARRGGPLGIHLALAFRADEATAELLAAHPGLVEQFCLRVALPGARGVLDPANAAADALPVGQVVVNARRGAAGANQIVTFPNLYEHPTAVGEHRRELWRRRAPGDQPPAVFEGSAAPRIADDPVYQALVPGRRAPRALVGRHLDATLSTAAVTLSPAPGRHLAVLGSSDQGAGILHAAATSLSRQHALAAAEFVLACYLPDVEGIARDAARLLDQAGHLVRTPSAAELPAVVAELAEAARAGPGTDDLARYLVLFGADTVSGRMQLARDGRSGLDALRTLLRLGPGRSIHVLGWWRTVDRFLADIGGSEHRDDVACLTILNLPGRDLGTLFDQPPDWQPRRNRALLADRHAASWSVLVPFAARSDDEVVR